MVHDGRLTVSGPSERFGVLRRSLRRAAAVAMAGAVAATSIPNAAQAQGRSVPLVRDTEIENLIRDYATPIFRAAGLSSNNIRIFIVRSREFNAFVVDQRRMFLNVGALQSAETPNEIIGVIAHETGHISGGHLARLRGQLAGAQTAFLAALLLGTAAAAAAVAGGVDTSQAAQGAGAALLGAGQVGQRNLLSYQRSEELAADRAAVNYLNATQQSSKGMLTVFERFAGQAVFTNRFVDPYARSHPMPRERIAALERVARASPYFDRRDPPALQARHDLMRAKISGFLDPPNSVFQKYPESDNSLPARYARAIARYRTADIRAAIRDIDGLIQSQPNNPYFRELKGQALLDSGRPREAIAPLERAVSLRPNAGLMRIMLGQALVATNDARLLPNAITQLRRGLSTEPDHALGFRQLAIAYGRQGNQAESTLASARSYFAEGNLDLARQQAARAQNLFARGSPGWLQADDILNVRSPRR